MAGAEASTQEALADFDGTVLRSLQETETALSAYANSLRRREALQAARNALPRDVRRVRQQFADASNLLLFPTGEDKRHRPRRGVAPKLHGDRAPLRGPAVEVDHERVRRPLTKRLEVGRPPRNDSLDVVAAQSSESLVQVRRVEVEDYYAPWHFLYFLPEPHGQGSLRPTRAALRTTCCTC